MLVCDMPKTERWRRIGDAPDYEVSDAGRVRRAVPDWQGKFAGHVLRPSIGRGGYRWHVLCVGGKKITRKLHRLVCEAFNGPQPEGRPHCAHRDGDSANNTPKNLYWATPAENSADRERHGRTARGDRSGARLHPERWPRGDQHWMRRMPEAVARGDNHYARARPHLVPRGERRASAKLTEREAREILAAPQYHGVGRDLAERYSVSMGLITAIRKRRAWAHLSLDTEPARQPSA